MVFKTDLNVKQDYMTCFHADLVESLMQGLGKPRDIIGHHHALSRTPPFKSTIQVKSSSNMPAPASSGSSKQHSKKSPFPPLDLSKVRKCLEQQKRREGKNPSSSNFICRGVQVQSPGTHRKVAEPGSSRRASPRKKPNLLECTGLHLRGFQPQSDNVATPRRTFSSRHERQHEHGKVADNNRKYNEEAKMDLPPIVAKDEQRSAVVERPPEVKQTPRLEEQAAAENNVFRVLPGIKPPSVPKAAESFIAAKPAEEASPRKSKLQFKDLRHGGDKKTHRSPRTSEMETHSKAALNTGKKSIKPSELNKSLISIGFGTAPVETAQTSRLARVAVPEASPRLALTDRSCYGHDKDAPAPPFQLEVQQWESYLSPEIVLKQFSSSLTEYEQREIHKYPEIYYLGNRQKKIQAIEAQGVYNFGFDNDRGDYNVIVHDHIAYRYEIVRKLGKGSFGQVLKCIDHKYKVLRAIKIIRNKKQFTQQAFIEINLLEYLRDKAAEEGADYNIVTLYESFDFRGHLCLSFAVHDISLFDMLKKNSFAGFSVGLIKCFAKQVLVALEFLHRSKIIHGDLKPENVLLQHGTVPKVKLIDFGSSCFEDKKIYTYIQSRFYRAPEVILGLPYDMMIDVWSFACILAELFTGYPLFPGEDEIEQLALIMEVLGTPPMSLINQAKRRKMFFDAENRPRIVQNSSGVRHFPSAKDLKSVIGCTDAIFVDFLSRCLKWDKAERMTPEQLLQHTWIKQIVPLTSLDEIRHKRRRSSAKVAKHKIKHKNGLINSRVG